MGSCIVGGCFQPLSSAMPITLTTVFLAALVTALATGLGAVPFWFTPQMPRRRLGTANALAAGLMLAASAMLLYEGGQRHLLYLALGAAAGYFFIQLTQRWLDRHDNLHIGMLQGADARKALLIVGVMTLHSLAEGIGVGVSYGGGEALGVFITTAIAIHNIPEGLAISLVLVPRGTPVWQAALWSIFSSLPQPLMAVPAFLFVEQFAPFLPFGLGFAAGAMCWMVAFELIPEARENASPTRITVVATLAALAMLAFQWWLSGGGG